MTLDEASSPEGVQMTKTGQIQEGSRREFLGSAAILTGVLSGAGPLTPVRANQLHTGGDAPVPLRAPRDIQNRVNVATIDPSSSQWKNLLLAFQRLQDRMKTDVTGYFYQAELHRRWCGGELGQIHGSWLFLRWHRAYLYFFEQLLQLAVPEANPPITIPYWDWTTQLNIPDVFFDSDSPLAHERDMQKGDKLPSDDVAVNLDLSFSRFGGTSRSPGDLEVNPHNNVHTDVGGDMRFIQKSSRDPLFWFHHANVDRLWASWQAMPGHPDPTNSDWRNTSFFFYTHPLLGPRQLTVSQVLSTTDLGYVYVQDLLVLAEAGEKKNDRLRFELPKGQLAKLTHKKTGVRYELRINGVTMPVKDTIRVWILLNLPADEVPAEPKSYKGYVGSFTLLPMEDREHAHPENFDFDMDPRMLRRVLESEKTFTVTLLFKSQAAAQKPGTERLQVKNVQIVPVD
jgi:hypothetical protein